jgi:hypothetical protein
MVTLHGALSKSQAIGAEDLRIAGGVDHKARVKKSVSGLARKSCCLTERQRPHHPLPSSLGCYRYSADGKHIIQLGNSGWQFKKFKA